MEKHGAPFSCDAVPQKASLLWRVTFVARGFVGWECLGCTVGVMDPVVLFAVAAPGVSRYRQDLSLLHNESNYPLHVFCGCWMHSSSSCSPLHCFNFVSSYLPVLKFCAAGVGVVVITAVGRT